MVWRQERGRSAGGRGDRMCLIDGEGISGFALTQGRGRPFEQLVYHTAHVAYATRSHAVTA